MRTTVGATALRSALRRGPSIVGTLATFCGCTNGDPSSQLDLRFDVSGAYADPHLFVAEVTQGGARRILPATSFTILSQSGASFSAELRGLRVQAGQPVTVRIAVLGAATDTAAAAIASWTPEANWVYGIGAEVAPQLGAFVCGAVAARLALPARGGSSGDSLFVVRGGLPQGAIC